MRCNIYAEELTDRIEIVEKTTPEGSFTGIRFYLELPVTIPVDVNHPERGMVVHRGPFMHSPGDDDSAAVTFWGKKDCRQLFLKALELLDQHYGSKS